MLVTEYLDPNARLRLLPEAETQARIKPTQIILHTIVGSAEGAFKFFRDQSSLESHFIVPFAGPRWQLIPCNRSADANRRANRRPDGTGAISVETEDNGGATIERTPWTDHQVDEIVELCVWACREFDIPARLCRTTSDPGIGYHTLFGAPSDWTPVAKSCPGAARKAQVPGIIKRVADTLAGSNNEPGDEPVQEEDDMPGVHNIIIVEGEGIFHVIDGMPSGIGLEDLVWLRAHYANEKVKLMEFHKSAAQAVQMGVIKARAK